MAKNLPTNAGDTKGSRLIPGSERFPAPVFLPGKFHGQRSLGLQSMWSQRVGHDRETEHTQTIYNTSFSICFFFKNVLKIKVELIYNVVLVSGVQQSVVVTYISVHIYI